MKKIAFFLLLLMSLLLCTGVSAQKSYEICNYGEATGITYVLELESGKEYIEVRDLSKLNMKYKSINNGIRISDSKLTMEIYFDEELNLGNYYFEEPLVNLFNVYYLDIDVLGKCFSSVYQKELRNGVWRIYLEVGKKPASEIPADGVQIEEMICDYANNIFIIHIKNQYSYVYKNVQIFISYYDKNGRLIDATLRNQYTISGKEETTVTLPVEKCIDSADSVKVMIWADGVPTDEKIILKDFKFDRDIKVPEDMEQIFGDVPTDYLYYNSIYIMNKQDLGTFYGYDDGNYYPDDYVMRSEFSYILSALLGMDFQEVEVDGSFRDISKEHWCKDMASFAVAKNYMTTTQYGEFLPEDYITINDALYTFLRVLGEDVTDGEKHIQKALERNLFKGPLISGYYITRGELAQLSYNFMMEYTKME